VVNVGTSDLGSLHRPLTQQLAVNEFKTTLLRPRRVKPEFKLPRKDVILLHLGETKRRPTPNDHESDLISFRTTQEIRDLQEHRKVPRLWGSQREPR
jgi:hypothetical protein